MKNNNRTVYQNNHGQWVNKLNGASKAASVHQTQAEANSAAASMLKKSGGGERTTMGRDGRIISKDTIAPGREGSTRDTEH